jgi:hypothetical protein
VGEILEAFAEAVGIAELHRHAVILPLGLAREVLHLAGEQTCIMCDEPCATERKAEVCGACHSFVDDERDRAEMALEAVGPRLAAAEAIAAALASIQPGSGYRHVPDVEQFHRDLIGLINKWEGLVGR